MIKGAGVLIYLCDCTAKISYPKVSKFVTLDLYWFYMLFFYGRIAFIFFYHLYLHFFSSMKFVNRNFTSKNTKLKSPTESNDKIVCGIFELIFRIVVLPVSMITGFYRFT
jgi:hypothetical protein